MIKKYETPVVEIVSMFWERNFCLSGDGTETVGTQPEELTDDDFE
jgi:hypothetical protein